MPEPFYRRDYGLGTVEEARKKKSQPTFENILQDKSSFMRNTDANKTRGLLSAFERSSKAKEDARKKEVQPQKNPWELSIPGGGIKKPTGRDGSFPSYDKDKDTGAGDTKTTVTPDPCGGRGRNPDGSCKEETTTGNGDKCAGKSLVCPSDRPNGLGECDSATGNVDFSSCTADNNCPYGKNPDGSCKEKPGDDNGGGTPSLTTINQPDETPMLQTLTSEMDLRNMLSNVLNKNNPLFKQARTRALQAMAGRGTVNSSMAEEAVTAAILNVAMPIAQRVIDDLQRVMAANVNATNAFKQAVNAAYYQELLLRVEAANTWNLTRMTEAGANWRAIMEARGRAADTSDPKVFDRYMDMLGGAPGFHLGTPTYDIAGT